LFYKQNLFLVLSSAGSAEVLNDSACPAVDLIDNKDDNSSTIKPPTTHAFAGPAALNVSTNGTTDN
jgi:hypothetical protein